MVYSLEVQLVPAEFVSAVARLKRYTDRSARRRSEKELVNPKSLVLQSSMRSEEESKEKGSW